MPLLHVRLPRTEGCMNSTRTIVASADRSNGLILQFKKRFVVVSLRAGVELRARAGKLVLLAAKPRPHAGKCVLPSVDAHAEPGLRAGILKLVAGKD